MQITFWKYPIELLFVSAIYVSQIVYPQVLSNHTVVSITSEHIVKYSMCVSIYRKVERTVGPVRLRQDQKSGQLSMNTFGHQS